MSEKEEEPRCEVCGKRPETETEEKIIKETNQCVRCIEKREIVKTTKAKMCHICKNITYPLNTFMHIIDGEETWLCNECSVKKNNEARP